MNGSDLHFALFLESGLEPVEHGRALIPAADAHALVVVFLECDIREEDFSRFYQLAERWLRALVRENDVGALESLQELEQFAVGACPLERGKLRRRWSLEGGEESGIREALLVVSDGVADELQAVAIEDWSGAFFPLEANSRTVSASTKM